MTRPCEIVASVAAPNCSVGESAAVGAALAPQITAPPPHSRCPQPTRSALLQARRALVRVGCTLFALALGGSR